jgi:hypothetical protein
MFLGSYSMGGNGVKSLLSPLVCRKLLACQFKVYLS